MFGRVLCGYFHDALRGSISATAPLLKFENE